MKWSSLYLSIYEALMDKIGSFFKIHSTVDSLKQFGTNIMGF